MTDKITKALETVNELHGETLKKLDDDIVEKLRDYSEYGMSEPDDAALFLKAAKEIERIRKQLAPFKERYDKFVKLAEIEGTTLDEVIKKKEEIDAESLRVSMTDPDLNERKFWLECDMAAHFELMCVKLIHEVNDD